MILTKKTHTNNQTSIICQKIIVSAIMTDSNKPSRLLGSLTLYNTSLHCATEKAAAHFQRYPDKDNFYIKIYLINDVGKEFTSDILRNTQHLDNFKAQIHET